MGLLFHAETQAETSSKSSVWAFRYVARRTLKEGVGRRRRAGREPPRCGLCPANRG
jgi:hypothetical protein